MLLAEIFSVSRVVCVGCLDLLVGVVAKPAYSFTVLVGGARGAEGDTLGAASSNSRTSV